MNTLYVLYDSRCRFCVECAGWLASQSRYLQLLFIPRGSTEVERRFPGLKVEDKEDDLIVVSDEGGVYRGASAWIMCLYALEHYRDWSYRLARPALMPLARKAFGVVSKSRRKLSAVLNVVSDAGFAGEIDRLTLEQKQGFL